jgi:L-lactate dehydrogenase
MPIARHRAEDLVRFATALLDKAGLESDKSEVVAQILVEGDLLGHNTHGLNMLAPYLNDLEKGGMTRSGSPRVIADFPAAVTWDGMRLPGTWLTVRAIDLALERAKTCGTCTVAIRRSHHIACLAAYLKRVTDQGMMVMLSSSGPESGGVVPHGGRGTGVYTPNPIAAAWPTAGDPVMIDVSMSITTHMLTGRLHKEGRRLPGEWVLDADGNPSDDPAVLFSEPKGGLLALGGTDHGHKGYALGLMVEALTGGLAGHGRADATEGWTATCRSSIRRSTAARKISSARPSGWRTPAAQHRHEADSIACGCPARPVCDAARNNSRKASNSTRASCRHSAPGARNSASPCPRLSPNK